MIYRNIEKLVLKYSNNMEFGEKLRELYWKERDEFEKEIFEQRHKEEYSDDFPLPPDGWSKLDLEDEPLTPKGLNIKGSYKDELPPSDYQLDN